LIDGAMDTTAPMASSRALASTRTGWEFFSRPGVDHHPWQHEPGRCAELIAR
jgi:hypothetical protein